MELTAIGIGHDVTRYYKRAVTIIDAEELGGVMTERLAELFEETAKPARRRALASARHEKASCMSPPARFLLFACDVSAADKPTDILPGAQAIAVQARPIANSGFIASAELPRLEWVGGLDLLSTAKGFGGFSSLAPGRGGPSRYWPSRMQGCGCP